MTTSYTPDSAKKAAEMFPSCNAHTIYSNNPQMNPSQTFVPFAGGVVILFGGAKIQVTIEKARREWSRAIKQGWSTDRSKARAEYPKNHACFG